MAETPNPNPEIAENLETSEAQAPPPYVHLHCHSEYSLLDGAGSLKRLVNKAAEFKMNSLALTDHGNMFGILKFYQRALDTGIKPILGYEAYLAPDSRFNRQYPARTNYAYHLTVLAQNHTGFKNLLKMATQAYTEGMYRRPRIDRELLHQYGEGLIILSGCLGGEINQHLINGNEPNWKAAYEVAEWYKKEFGDRFYLEIQNNGIDLQQRAARFMIEMAEKTGIPLVATSDVHYVEKKDAPIQDILLCINTGKKRVDEDRMRMDTDQFYFRSQQEMYDAFPGQEAAVARSQEIADRCNVELELGKRFFPVFTPPDGKDEVEYLREVALEGLRDRYADEPKRWVNGEIGGDFTSEVYERLETELSVIKRQGFPNYFLVVWDFVRAAHEKGISCTARGSGVGSLVCFGLGLSRVCPLEYDLLFERFLDVNRKEAPDIDIDFEQARREEVLQYVRDTYGADHVAQIGTFGTMAAKAAIKDVGRVLGFPVSSVEEITSKVPKTPKITIDKALKANPEFQEAYDTNPEVAEIVDLAKGCEGLARQPGTHACGVLITPQPVVNFVPMHTIRNKSGLVTQWEGAEVEASGLLKMDFLGLRNLSILSQTMNFIKETTGKDINPYRFPHDNQPTYDLLCRGETKGVFQLEGEGIRNLLQKLKPDNFRDIIAMLALYRPGPLGGGMVDQYIDVKHGRATASYIHPVLEDVLTETHGVMVYQEQVMRILNRLGKIELADAYKCIKAISKKKIDKIAHYQSQFISGCQENDLTEKDAEHLFDLIIQFAGYGFNKSHLTAYAKIAYITAYLKCHFPVEFMAALLTGDIDQRNFKKKDKTVEHIEDCQRMGVEVVLPSVNTSAASYRIEDGKIHFAMTAISGVNETFTDAIRKERLANGPYLDLFDFCERNAVNKIPRSTLLSLLDAGCFDCFEGNRAQLEAVLDRAIQAGEATVADKRSGQMSLFDMFEPASAESGEKKREVIDLPDIPEWPDKEKLAREKKVLGFYRSGHPLAEYRESLQFHCTHNTTGAKNLPHMTQVVLGGIVGQLEKKATKSKNELYARFELEDEEGTIPCILWPRKYTMYGDCLSPDAVILCVGSIDNRKQQEEAQAAEKAAKLAKEKAEREAKEAKEGKRKPPKDQKGALQNLSDDDEDDDDDDDLDTMGDDSQDDDSGDSGGGGISSVSFLIDKIVTIESLRRDYTEGLRIRIFEEDHTPETLKTLKEILRSSPGSERLELEIFTKDRNRVVMQCDFTLKATQEILSQVQNLLGIQNVQQIIRKIEPEKREEPAWKKNRRSWKRDSDS